MPGKLSKKAGKWTYAFDPFKLAPNRKKPRGKKLKDILDDVSDLVETEILRKVAKGQSPVKGARAFAALDKEYAAKKKGEFGNSKPNLEAQGDMLDDLTVEKDSKSTKLLVFVDDKAQQGKVDGHNNFTGKSPLPRRAFIPENGFKADIEKKIKNVIESQTEPKTQDTQEQAVRLLASQILRGNDGN